MGISRDSKAGYPEMIFKVSCTKESAERAKEILRGRGLDVVRKDMYCSDYYAVGSGMSYLGAYSLAKELESDPEILRAEANPALGERAWPGA